MIFTPMSDVSPTLVKQLREKTNAGMMDCKKALVEAGGDLEKAEDILRKKGIASASKKASRSVKEGVVASYIHLQGKVGVLVEVNCETDFVAKNEIFREFVKDLTLHIAAAHPVYVVRDGSAKLVQVQIGMDTGQLVAIESGLNPKDQVIAQAPPALRDGTPVVVASPEEDSAKAP